MEADATVVVEAVEAGLLERLRPEFGDRVVDLLDAAHGLLSGGVGMPRVGEIVAFCVREAFGEILKRSSIGGGEFKELSRRVVETRKNLDDLEASPDEKHLGGLEELLEAIDALDRFQREQEDLAVRQLREVVLNRAGRVLLSGHVERFRGVRRRANQGLRKAMSVSDTRCLWSDSVRLLGQLFMPPSQRLVELEALARLDSPTAEDVESVVGLLSGPDLVRWFFSNVKAPTWLGALEKSEHLQPFRDRRNRLLEWPALAAVSSLLPDHRDEVEAWLESRYARYGKEMVEVPWRDPDEMAGADSSAVPAPGSGAAEETGTPKPWKEPVWAHHLALAALNADPPMPGIVLTAVRNHPTFRDIVLVGVSVVRKLPPSDSLVEDFANMLLGESCWKAWPHADPVVESLVKGINEDNAAQRVRLLCYKLRPSPQARTPTFFEWNQDGSIVEIANDPPFRRRLFVLTKGLTDAIRRAGQWLTTRDILDITGAIRLPPGLGSRLRAWTLATSSDFNRDMSVREVEEALSSRFPTGDHLSLIERVIGECDQSLYAIRWRKSLGPVPDVEHVERVAAAGDLLPESWVKAWQWAGILPDDITGEWAPVCRALKSQYGQPDRTGYEYRPRRAKRATSPISARELRTLGPVEGARRIARWRPDRTDWASTAAGARELGRTLETVVKDNPEEWTADPLGTANTLHHPTYIGHYLKGVTAVSSEEVPLNELLDVINLVRTRPWEAQLLGRDAFAYDPDWSGAEAASVELIKSLARAQGGFADRTDEVWDFIEARTADCSETPQSSDGATRDIYQTANRLSCTRALKAALHLVEDEYHRSTAPHRRAVPLLERSLRIPGDHGKLHRVILAEDFAFLHHVLAAWTEGNLDLFFGDQAPTGLGQATFNMVIQWGQPQPRILERYQPMLKQAVRARVSRALRSLMIAMLCETDGYSPQQNLNFLRQAHKPQSLNREPATVGDARNPTQNSHPNHVSEAAASLAWLLQDDKATPRHLQIAQDFWEAAQREGNLSLQGFGWFAEVTAFDPDRWADLTLKTLEASNGRIHAPTQIAQRIAPMTPSETTLTILDTLLQGALHQNLRTDIAEHAREHLRSATTQETTPEYQRLRNLLQERNITDN